MSLEFPFEYAEIEGLGKLFYPIVRLEIKTISGWREFEFLVDTGADVTTVPDDLLPILGLEKSTLKTGKTQGVGGTYVKTWELRLPLRLGKMGLIIKARAVKSLNDPMPLLLGRKDIFEDRFNLVLDSRQKITRIIRN